MRRSYKLGLATFVALIMAAIAPVSVSALTNIFTDQSNDGAFSPTHLFPIVTKAGGGVTLDAPNTDVNIFVPANLANSSHSWRLILKGGCQNMTDDIGDTSIGVAMFQRTSTTGVGAQLGTYATNFSSPFTFNGCFGSDLLFGAALPGNYFNTSLPEYGGKYGVMVARITKFGNAGLKNFRIQVVDFNTGTNNGAIATFAELPLSTAKSLAQPSEGFVSVWDGTDTVNSVQSTIKFTFSPSCNFNDATPNPGDWNNFLRWYDADVGQSDQQFGILGFTLRDNTAGTNVLSENAIQNDLGGNGPGSYRVVGVHFISGHKYTWTWTGVDRQNGIQFWLPFSEINSNITCPSATPSPTPKPTPTPAPTPSPTPTCGSISTNPGAPEAGVSFVPSASYTFSGGPAPAAPTSAKLTINGTGFNQTYTYPPPGQLDYSPSGTTGTLSVPSGVTIGQAGSYNVTVTITAYGTTKACNGTISVYSKPYLSVNGGDVSAGGGVVTVSSSTFKPVASPSCAINNGAQIASWNKRNTSASAGGTVYDGAGTSVAGFALSDITDFSSGQASVATPIGLSFANNSVGAGTTVKNDPQSGQFGGQFGAAPGCDPTIVNTALSTGNILPNAAAAPGASGAFTISGGVGSNNIYVLKGANVVINNDITDAGGSNPSWADVPSIPHFQLVVLGGSIYIGPNVHNLDGLYYAAPDSNGIGGEIYTCANGTTPVAKTSLSANCSQDLTVNGSLMAKRLYLLRTAGTLNDAPNGAAAETINYSPEVWITTGGSSKDDAYTSLPPVL